MKVLEVFGEPISHGGQEAFVFSVLDKMDMTDLKIDFFTPYYSDNPRYEDMIRLKNGTLFAGNLDFSPGGSRRNIISPLKAILRDGKYDVVHIHSGSISVLSLAARAAKKMGVNKVIVHSHADGISKNLKYRISRIINSYNMNNYPDVYCACSLRAGEWKFSKRIVKNQLIIIKNGIDVDRFSFNKTIRDRIRMDYQIETNEILIGQVGRLSVQKNHLFTLKMFKELHLQANQYKLMFVGDGELRNEIEAFITDNGLDDYVILVGSVNNVQDYLSAMDVFVFPSLYEGFGIVAIEAEATGLPVIAANQLPKDMNVTGKVIFESLDDIDGWISDILSVDIANRTDDTRSIVETKHDSSSVAKTVRDLYFS